MFLDMCPGILGSTLEHHGNTIDYVNCLVMYHGITQNTTGTTTVLRVVVLALIVSLSKEDTDTWDVRKRDNTLPSEVQLNIDK